MFLLTLIFRSRSCQVRKIMVKLLILRLLLHQHKSPSQGSPRDVTGLIFGQPRHYDEFKGCRLNSNQLLHTVLLKFIEITVIKSSGVIMVLML